MPSTLIHTLTLIYSPVKIIVCLHLPVRQRPNDTSQGLEIAGPSCFGYNELAMLAERIKKHKLAIAVGVIVAAMLLVVIADSARRRRTEAFLRRYEITDLTALGVKHASKLNDLGQVAGCVGRHLYIWDKANGLKTVRIPLGIRCYISGMNNNGQVAGQFEDANSNRHAFFWDTEHDMVVLGTLGGNNSSPIALNDNGQVIGTSETTGGSFHPFLWHRTTGMIDLSTSINSPIPLIAAYDLNNAGKMVCVMRRGFGCIWDKQDGLVPLAAPKGGITLAYNINDAGAVVGVIGEPNKKKSNLVLWTDPNHWREIRTITGKGKYCVPTALNNRGQIIGQERVKGILSDRLRSFFWSQETGLIVFGDRLNLALPWKSGPSLTMSQDLQFIAINNQGQILCIGDAADGQRHFLLMNPVTDAKKQ